MKLERWPATKISRMVLKFPHTQTFTSVPGTDIATPAGVAKTYQTYTIPSAWVSLRRNRINVVAAYGAITVSTDQSAVASAGGIFSYITGFGRGAYQPAMIEVTYTAGFEADKYPSSVWSAIITLASLKFLRQVAPALMPYTNVSVSIDGVAQSANVNLYQMISNRIDTLEKEYMQRVNAITRNFGRTLKVAFIGA
jgi:hypothetical protein